MKSLYTFALLSVLSLVTGAQGMDKFEKAKYVPTQPIEIITFEDLENWFGSGHVDPQYAQAGKDFSLISKSASEKGTVKDLSELLMQGANVNGVDEQNFTPLSYLLYKLVGKSLNPADRAKIMLLLQKGANPNIRTYVDMGAHGNKTALDFALDLGDAQLIRLLARYGAQDIIRSNTVKFSNLLQSVFKEPLLRALVGGYPGAIATLVEKNRAIKDDEGFSALAYAAGQGNEKVLSLLLSRPEYNNPTLIEQAIKIAHQKLLGFAPESPEYKRYKSIFEALKRELALIYGSLGEALGAVAHGSGLPTPEPFDINKYLKKLIPGSGHIDFPASH
jgi:hypothetical protein